MKTTYTVTLFNKPFNVLCQFSPEGDKQTLKNYINTPNIYPAGRLDYDSEGLLLLTDNGDFIHKITHPKHKLPKTYYVQVEGVPKIDALNEMRKGLNLKDGLTKAAKVSLLSDTELSFLWDRNPPIRFRQSIPTTWLSIEITEGKNRQVRRMCAHIGTPCLRLIRIKVGHVNIIQEGLKPGECKQIQMSL